MRKRPYRPSGASESGAFPVLFGGCLAAGTLAGVAEGLLARYLISLLILFPIGIGLAAGGFGAWRIGKDRVRAPLAGAVAAILGALAGQATVHLMAYQAFRSEATASMRLKGMAEPEPAIDRFLAEETGRDGFLGYLELTARSGITLKRGGSKGMNLSGLGAWILWAVELLLAMGVGGGIAWDRARQPFCERCKRWYMPPEPVGVGSPKKEAWQAALRAVERGDHAAAAAALGQPEQKATSVLRLARCPQCDTHEPLLSLAVVTGTHTRKPQTRVKHETLLRADEARALTAALQAARAAAPPAAPTPG